MKLHLALSILALAAAVAAPALAKPRPSAGLQPPAEPQPWRGASVIDDPEWRARFLGSYGFLSGAEPEVRQDEVELLREVVELMSADPAAAAAMLEKQIDPTSSAALDFVLANLEFQTGDEQSAIRHYRSALEKFPDFRRAHKNLGLLLVQENDFSGALEHLTRAVELGDRDGRSFGLIGHCYINQENYLAAEEAYRNAILQQPGVKDWKAGLARALLEMERYKEAVALFDSLIEATPEDPALWMLQANAYIGLEQPLAAAVNLEAVRMMGIAQSSSLVLLGDIYMNAGMPDLAKSAYLEVVASDEGATQFKTAYRAAELLVRTRAFDEGEEMLASIERRYSGELPQDDELKLLTLKAKLANARGRRSEAAEIFESIVERDGTRGDALLELASYYHGQGEQEKALLVVERAEKLKGFEYQALLSHAQFMVSERDYRKAAELLRRALEIKSEPRVEQFLARVEQAIRPE
jgi:tetratricopeptide (TPR) repeat protein